MSPTHAHWQQQLWHCKAMWWRSSWRTKVPCKVLENDLRCVWLLEKSAETTPPLFLLKCLPTYLCENKRTGRICPVQNCHQLNWNLSGEAHHCCSKTKKEAYHFSSTFAFPATHSYSFCNGFFYELHSQDRLQNPLKMWDTSYLKKALGTSKGRSINWLWHNLKAWKWKVANIKHSQNYYLPLQQLLDTDLHLE